MKILNKLIATLLVVSLVVVGCERDDSISKGHSTNQPSLKTLETAEQPESDVSIINGFFASSCFTNFQEIWIPNGYHVILNEIRRGEIDDDPGILVYGFNLTGPSRSKMLSQKLYGVYNSQDKNWNGFVSRRFDNNNLRISELGRGGPEDPMPRYNVDKDCRSLGGTCAECTSSFDDCYGCAWDELNDDVIAHYACALCFWCCEAAVFLHCKFGQKLDPTNIRFKLINFKPQDIKL